MQAHSGILLSRLLEICRLFWSDVCVYACVQRQEEFVWKDEDKDRTRRKKRIQKVQKIERESRKKGNEWGGEMIWTRRHGRGQVNEAWLCVCRRGVAEAQRGRRQKGERKREGEGERRQEAAFTTHQGE